MCRHLGYDDADPLHGHDLEHEPVDDGRGGHHGAPHLAPLWVECKNVTMVEDGVACFPDAATERGQKHLRELMDIVRCGERAAMFYLVQRPDGHCFGPADVVDPAYAALFYEAMDAGVEIYPYRASVSPAGIELEGLLPVAPRPAGL